MKERGTRHCKVWTDDETYTLIEHLDDISSLNYKKLLPGRSLSAISYRLGDQRLWQHAMNNRGLCYRVSEAAAILGVHPRAIRRWIHAGFIKGIEEREALNSRSGGRKSFYRIPFPSLDQFVMDFPMLLELDKLPATSTRQRDLLTRAHPENWIKTVEAAAILSVDINTVLGYDHLPRRVVRGACYYLRSDVESLKDQYRRKSYGAAIP